MSKQSNRMPNSRSKEEVEQLLSQAKHSGDHFQIKVWTACLAKIEQDIKDGTYNPRGFHRKHGMGKEVNWVEKAKIKKD